MKYYEVNFQIEPCNSDFADVLSALIAEIGFETFEPTETGLKAYIQQEQLNEDELNAVIETFPILGAAITYNKVEALDENWNKVWEEEGFQPISIGHEIYIHDKSLPCMPDVAYDIKIHPQQAFGTGSHQTTRMILAQLLKMDLKGKTVVDAGTGTGILTIMAHMKGASHVYAYDIDEWSVRNAKENLEINDTMENVEVLMGDCQVLRGIRDTDLLIANINRNILLHDMPEFKKALAPKGMLLISGFYQEDIPMLEEQANKLGLYLKDRRFEEKWAMLLFESDAFGRTNI